MLILLCFGYLDFLTIHGVGLLYDGCFQRRNVYGACEQYLGLEHPENTPKRAFAANQWNFVFLSLGRPEYLLDSDVVSSRSQDEGDSTRSWHLFTSGDIVQKCSTAKDPQFSEDSDNDYSYGSSSTDDDCNPAMDVDTDSGDTEVAVKMLSPSSTQGYKEFQTEFLRSMLKEIAEDEAAVNFLLDEHFDDVQGGEMSPCPRL
ncbi:hypothetical protein ACET3Z_009961 [Daucus carota]